MIRHGNLDDTSHHDDMGSALAGAFESGAHKCAHEFIARDDGEMPAQAGS